jgi:hypothetical protein
MKREKGIYRPKLPSSPTTLPKGQRCKHKDHGTTDVCPGCKAIFGKVFWVRYSADGRFIRESTECTTKKGAQECQGSSNFPQVWSSKIPQPSPV